MLYGTTQKFLEHFGLRDIDDMPKAAELRLQAAALKTAEQKAEEARAKTGAASPVSGETPDSPPGTGDATTTKSTNEGQTSATAK
jgi:hypothetical protein